MIDFITSNEFWAILFKCLLTAVITACIALLCTTLGKIIAKCNNSKLARQARIAVRAAEQKFPNEGKKMGPEKMAYVMDYLAITFPKIKSNQYLYNIAEAAVYELNNKDIEEEAKKQFKDKYGDLPEEYSEQEFAKVDAAVEKHTAKVAAAEAKTQKDDFEFNLKSF